MSMKYYHNYKTGETGYIDVHDNTTGAGCHAYYKFSHFALHVAIAGITGLISASISGSTVLGILIGIASLFISTIIHLIKEGELFASYVDKGIIIKRMIAYTITISVAIGVSVLCYSIFGIGIASIVALVALFAVIMIIKKIDYYT